MRKAKMLLAFAAVVATVMPFTSAQAEHCDSNIVIITSYGGTGTDTGGFACIAGETGEEYNIINPGSNQLLVRYQLAGGQPIEHPALTNVIFPGIATCGAGNAITGGCKLKFTLETLAGGGQIWRAQNITLTNGSTITNSDLTVTICTELAAGDPNACAAGASESRSVHTVV